MFFSFVPLWSADGVPQEHPCDRVLLPDGHLTFLFSARSLFQSCPDPFLCLWAGPVLLAPLVFPLLLPPFFRRNPLPTMPLASFLGTQWLSAGGLVHSLASFTFMDLSWFAVNPIPMNASNRGTRQAQWLSE